MTRDTTKSWAQIYEELSESMRKWSGSASTWSIESAKKGRAAEKRYQTLEERAVTLRFRFWTSHRDVALTMRARERAVDNLQALAAAVEHLRLAEVRGIAKLLVFAYRQMDPGTPVQPAVSSSPPAIPSHYRCLGILPDAPLEVAEAAYKALARRAHPDAGGSTARMQQLNAAIEQIRKER